MSKHLTAITLVERQVTLKWPEMLCFWVDHFLNSTRQHRIKVGSLISRSPRNPKTLTVTSSSKSVFVFKNSSETFSVQKSKRYFGLNHGGELYWAKRSISFSAIVPTILSAVDGTVTRAVGNNITSQTASMNWKIGSELMFTGRTSWGEY